MANDFSLSLDRFTGLRLKSAGESAVFDGKSPDMKNFTVTQSAQLKLREGYETVFCGEGEVRLLWHGALKEKECYLALIGRTLYRFSDAFITAEVLGQLSGEGNLTCLEFREKLYFLTGEDIFVYDGDTLSPITPYRPLIRISSPPSGGGVPFEDVNLLTDKVRQSFSPDGVATSFTLAESRVKTVDYVLRDGLTLKPDVDYIADAEHGSVRIFGEDGGEVTDEGTDNIEIGYTLSDYVKSDVYSCRYGILYGGENDTRAFLYGAKGARAMRFHSGIADGVPSLEYFPASGASTVGDGEKITSMVRHYDRQIIFTPHATYYSYPETRTDETGREYTSFPVYTLSAVRGNAVEGLSLLVSNKPLSVLPSGLYLWNSTSIRDERNAECISEDITPALLTCDMTGARCFLRNATQELYLVTECGIFVYHFGMKLFYRYEGYTPTVMLEDAKNACFFGTADGKICRLGALTDDGEGIEAHWESGALYCQDRTHTKNLFDVTLGLDSESVSPFLFSYSCDNLARTEKRVNSSALKKQRLLSFLNPDFADFSFDTASTEKMRRIRICAKRFSYINICISHPKSEVEPLNVTHLILRGKINDQHT